MMENHNQWKNTHKFITIFGTKHKTLKLKTFKGI